VWLASLPGMTLEWAVDKGREPPTRPPDRAPRSAQVVQRTTVVGRTTDPLEREADSVARHVVATLGAANDGGHRGVALQREGRIRPLTANRGPDVIRRAPLTADGIMTSLDSIPFIKDKLADAMRGETMRAHVEKVLNEHTQMFGGATSKENEAVMISAALNGVARIIAKELYDPDIQPRLAAKLIELYRTEIEAAVNAGRTTTETKQTSSAIDLAGILVSDDPVTLYMHGEARLDKASTRIVAMARYSSLKAKQTMTPTQIFDMLSQRFQAEMASFTRTKLAASEDTRGTYNVKESTGEISAKWFKDLFGDVETAPKRTTSTGLRFTREARAKLKLLGDEVKRLERAASDAKVPTDRTATVVASGSTRGGAKLTDRQEQHLSEIEQAEARRNTGSVRDDVAQAFMTMFLMDEAKARATLAIVENWLPTMPITITVGAEDWFGRKDDAPSQKKGTSSFKPATAWTHDASVEELFDKAGAAGTIEYRGKYEHPKYAEERGENYLRFRAWKDRLMTSLLDFTPAEMPTFGAANVNWEATRGSAGFDTKSYGKNYYGDMHFLMKDSVRTRLIFTATDHGAPRRDPLLALHDFCVGGSHTGLKDVKKEATVVEIVNAATTGTPIGADLPFEVQIFGGIDIAKDVAKIFVKGDASKIVVQNLKSFTKKTKVPHEVMSTIPTGVMASASTVKKSLREADIPAEQTGDLIDDSMLRPIQVLAKRARALDVKTARDKRLCTSMILEARSLYANVPPLEQPKVKPLVDALNAVENALTLLPF
jgi:hypothetical protein